MFLYGKCIFFKIQQNLQLCVEVLLDSRYLMGSVDSVWCDGHMKGTVMLPLAPATALNFDMPL